MIIELWGVRGSAPTPLSQSEYRSKIQSILIQAIQSGLTQTDDKNLDEFINSLPRHLRHLFGGNTTCVTLTNEHFPIPYIIDCGSGVIRLGNELLQGPCGKGQGEIRIFLTHTHWDHIQGIPFFKPLYIPGNRIHFYSAIGDLEERLERQQEDAFFPAPFHKMAATKEFHLLEPGKTLELEGELRIDCQPLNHPGGSVAYRFIQNDRIFIMATDTEFTGDDLMDEEFLHHFFEDADLLIMDAQYSLDESFGKFDWGHTSTTMAVNIANKWRVKNLIMTHHEPAYDDQSLNESFENALEHRENLGVQLPNLYMAREGMIFKLSGKKP